MDCTETNEKLGLLVLGELADADRQGIEAHLRICPACRHAHDECRRTVGAIKAQTPPAAVRPAFESSLRHAINVEIQAARIRRRVAWLMPAAAAAAMLLISAGIWSMWHSSADTAAPRQGDLASVAAPIPHLWQTGGARATTASTADDVIVSGKAMYALLGEGQGRVVALDARTGGPLWKSNVQSLGYLAAGQDRVYCLAAANGIIELVAMDAADGSVLWRYAQTKPNLQLEPCRPLVLGDGQICWTNGDTVHLLSAADGTAVWTRPIRNEGMLSNPVAEDGVLYVAGAAAMHCLDAASGEESWQLAFDGASARLGRPLLAASGGKVYVANRRAAGESPLVCIDAAGRRTLWTNSTPNVTHMLATPQAVYVRGQAVQALDSATGRRAWACKAEGCGPVTWADGLVYFVDSSKSGSLVALHGDAGRRAWELPGLQSCNTFNCADGAGFIKTRDGVIHAIPLAASKS